MITVKQLFEMANNLGRPVSDMDLPDYRKKLYNHHINSPKIKTLSHNISLHKLETPNKTEISTLDNDKKEAIHHAIFTNNKKSNNFPFDNQEQSLIERKKNENSSDLPKGYATNITYDHFKGSKLPLRSSDNQTTAGHNMWKKLVHRSLKDNYHVYHWDGSNLHKTTKENADKHLNTYFNSGHEFKNKHMILSKTELENK